MAKGNRTGKGYFKVEGDEPKAKLAIAVRLPQSLDEQLREKLEGKQLVEWLRQAAIEKFERDINAYQVNQEKA